jgi:Zn-dependent protease with chaperone function
MDFFAAQARSRRNSRQLLLLFFIAVVVILCAIYLVVALLIGQTPFFDAGLLAGVFFGGGVFLVGLAFFHINRIRKGGGAAVAKALGGRQVPTDTTIPREQRILHKVEALAMAAGMATPAVFILDQEPKLNAFAAGNGLQDSVVALTHGLLDALPDEELEAVMGHELSHILQGDTRLNMRLMGAISGLVGLHVAGRFLLSLGRGRLGGSVLGALGLGLAFLGALGAFLSRLIQAAFSREREFMADATAAHITQNPEALARALERIAAQGAGIAHHRALEARHFFLCAVEPLAQTALATHPPIAQRIACLRGQSHADHRAGMEEEAPDCASFEAHQEGIGQPGPAHLQGAKGLWDALPHRLREAVHRPSEAAILVGALLIPPAPLEGRQIELTQLRMSYGETGLAFLALIQSTQSRLAHPGLRLVLVNLALPALRELPGTAQAKLLQFSESLMREGTGLELFGLSIRFLLRKRLEANPLYPPLPPSIHSLREDSSLLLGMMAHHQASTETQARLRFQTATAHAPLRYLYLPAPSAITGRRLEPALVNLAQTPLDFRKGLIIAALAMIQSDQHLVGSQLEGVCAMCEALECPMPLPIMPLPLPSTPYSPSCSAEL